MLAYFQSATRYYVLKELGSKGLSFTHLLAQGASGRFLTSKTEKTNTDLGCLGTNIFTWEIPSLHVESLTSRTDVREKGHCLTVFDQPSFFIIKRTFSFLKSSERQVWASLADFSVILALNINVMRLSLKTLILRYLSHLFRCSFIGFLTHTCTHTRTENKQTNKPQGVASFRIGLCLFFLS